MKKKIKLFSMFSGYGGAEFALQKSEIEFETVGYSEIDKYAIQCYEQNHSKIKNYGDATKIKVEELPDFDLLTGGFPCQSFSQAGNRAGTCDSRGTLFWDIWRIAKEKKPKYMLLENVKGLTTKTFKDTFDKILLDLDAIGYQVDWKVLNSKNYGIPQNRERVWFVCQRKDIARPFEWPEKKELDIFIKDILEEKVDEKYWPSKKLIEGVEKSNYRERKPIKISDHIMPTLKVGGDQKRVMFGDGRWRHITPKEKFRLMGFLNDEINLGNLSDTQKYKLAGNGWDINIVSKIFERLLKQI